MQKTLKGSPVNVDINLHPDMTSYCEQTKASDVLTLLKPSNCIISEINCKSVPMLKRLKCIQQMQHLIFPCTKLSQNRPVRLTVIIFCFLVNVYLFFKNLMCIGILFECVSN